MVTSNTKIRKPSLFKSASSKAITTTIAITTTTLIMIIRTKAISSSIYRIIPVERDRFRGMIFRIIKKMA